MPTPSPLRRTPPTLEHTLYEEVAQPQRLELSHVRSYNHNPTSHHLRQIFDSRHFLTSSVLSPFPSPHISTNEQYRYISVAQLTGSYVPDAHQNINPNLSAGLGCGEEDQVQVHVETEAEAEAEAQGRVAFLPLPCAPIPRVKLQSPARPA